MNKIKKLKKKGITTNEQNREYKLLILDDVIPFNFHVVVESVHDNQLILFSDVLCRWRYNSEVYP